MRCKAPVRFHLLGEVASLTDNGCRHDPSRPRRGRQDASCSDQLFLNDTRYFKGVQTIEITNTNSHPIVYSFENVAAEGRGTYNHVRSPLGLFIQFNSSGSRNTADGRDPPRHLTATRRSRACQGLVQPLACRSRGWEDGQGAGEIYRADTLRCGCELVPDLLGVGRPER